ncbi:MAG: hypothetical protein ACRDTA_18470 [Pseudonocardiaceae bacterium]
MPPPLRLFDHHIHSDGRNADDYELMAISGVTSVLVPCSASNERRPSGESWAARFDRLLDTEVARAARYGIDLYVALAVHAADIVDLSSALGGIAELTSRLGGDRVLAVGELSLRRFDDVEIEAFRRQLHIAVEFGLPVMVETPPPMPEFAAMVDVLRGLLDRGGLDPSQLCLLDLDRDKVRLVTDLQVGAYGLPVSPALDGLFCIRRKLTHLEVIAILEEHGPDRLMLNTGFHFGSADPLGLAKTVHRLRLAGVSESILQAIGHDNAAGFFRLPRR